MCRLFVATLFILSGSPGWSDTDVDTLLSNLQFPMEVDVNFQQTQLSPLLKRVNQQRGRLRRLNDNSLVMWIDHPRREERRLANGLVTVRRQHAGKERFRQMQLDPQRPSHLVLLALEAVTQGNRRMLDRHFDMSVQARADSWQITFVPRAQQIRQQLTHLLVSGQGERLTHLRSERIRADGTLSHWLQVSIDPVPAD